MFEVGELVGGDDCGELSVVLFVYVLMLEFYYNFCVDFFDDLVVDLCGLFLEVWCVKV